MAKKKTNRIEKETRKLIETTSDLIRERPDGSFKIKGRKKKEVKNIKLLCPHWIIKKRKERATVIDADEPGVFQCRLCNAKFWRNPLDNKNIDDICDYASALVHQIGFYMILTGCDTEDAQIITKLKRTLPRFRKMAKNVSRQITRRNDIHKNRGRDTDNFTGHSLFKYNLS